jgi:hypothetical protein
VELREGDERSREGTIRNGNVAGDMTKAEKEA